jgi:uncharacterized RDD family membrane protein YckC
MPTISIKTPENIEFSYDIAGIGSRFVANIIDTMIQSAIISAISASLILGGLVTFSFNVSAAPWVFAIALVVAFAIFVGYYMFFEIIWNGQTPGKRLVQIRVVKEGGYPIGASDAIVRNMLRSVDFLPFFYAFGALVMLVSKRSKRLGDYVAGTIVVKDRRLTAPKAIELLSLGQLGQSSTETAYYSSSYNHRLSNAELELVSKFLNRRDTFKDRDVRQRLAKKLAYSLAQKLQIDPNSLQGREERFLESLVSEGGGRNQKTDEEMRR